MSLFPTVNPSQSQSTIQNKKNPRIGAYPSAYYCSGYCGVTFCGNECQLQYGMCTTTAGIFSITFPTIFPTDGPLQGPQDCLFSSNYCGVSSEYYIFDFLRNIVLLVVKVFIGIVRVLLDLAILLADEFVPLSYVAQNMVIVGAGRLTLGLAARLIIGIASDFNQLAVLPCLVLGLDCRAGYPNCQ
jgi:hypothetical protein